jgi:hypothetical protein
MGGYDVYGGGRTDAGITVIYGGGGSRVVMDAVGAWLTEGDRRVR